MQSNKRRIDDDVESRPITTINSYQLLDNSQMITETEFSLIIKDEIFSDYAKAFLTKGLIAAFYKFNNKSWFIDRYLTPNTPKYNFEEEDTNGNWFYLQNCNPANFPLKNIKFYPVQNDEYANFEIDIYFKSDEFVPNSKSFSHWRI